MNGFLRNCDGEGELWRSFDIREAGELLAVGEERAERRILAFVERGEEALNKPSEEAAFSARCEEAAFSAFQMRCEEVLLEFEEENAGGVLTALGREEAFDEQDAAGGASSRLLEQSIRLVRAVERLEDVGDEDVGDEDGRSSTSSGASSDIWRTNTQRATCQYLIW